MNPEHDQLMLIEPAVAQSTALPSSLPDEARQSEADDIQRMLAATDSILAEALSGDSRQFLEQVRQHGGQ